MPARDLLTTAWSGLWPVGGFECGGHAPAFVADEARLLRLAAKTPRSASCASRDLGGGTGTFGRAVQTAVSRPVEASRRRSSHL